jgi:3,4-dihydroxy 2-butanone 4-phosphate synthase/GTP cyclohydrolase II
MLPATHKVAAGPLVHSKALKRFFVGLTYEERFKMSFLPAISAVLESAAIPFDIRFQQAMDDMRRGHPVILVDDFDRENEADLVVAAEQISVPSMALLIRECSGIVCLCLTGETADRLELPLMVPDNESRFQTAFTISVDAREGVTTGVSAQDRVTTVRAAVADDAEASSLVRPGHIFPLRAAAGGVLTRAGHTEGSVDLARMAGLKPAAVICEITNPDGSMAKGDDIDQFAREHDMVVLSIAELVEHRLGYAEADRTAKAGTGIGTTRHVATADLPTRWGHFRALGFERSTGDDLETAVALILGDVSAGAPLVRIHSECLTGDVFGSLRCDCGEQVNRAMKAIAEEGAGILIYEKQEGRGIGLMAKLQAYALQDEGLDTVEANQHLGLAVDSRDFALPAGILQHLGVHQVRLLTNNPQKVAALTAAGIQVVERVACEVSPGPEALFYLTTKKVRLGHLLEMV